MFSAALEKATSLFDRRFLINAFFPSFIFCGLSVVVAIAGQGDLVSTANAWNQQNTAFQIVTIVGFISLVTFFSSILVSNLTTIVRLYEGYWNFPLNRYLKKISTSWYQNRLKELGERLDQDPSYYEEIYLNYPLPNQLEQVMPTRVGNILKNAELYPLIRYKIDAVLIWPRLYNLFPEHFIQTLAEARSSFEFMLVRSFLGGAFALLSSIYLLIVGGTWWLFLLCFWGGLLVAWFAYNAALGSARLYAQQVKAAFDLYRNELLIQMRLPLPTNLKEEREQWQAIGQFLYRNLPGSLKYTNDEADSSGQKQA
ncbi:hypothetical protein [Allocoleopsis sp.]|uniref:hypothetical protein n=1 Tax=Allocoleopsis sp. TaxID=3088169 RepID=UPI002FD475A2